MRLKILNLYSGIGGNRKLWPNDEIEVTAIEHNEEIAQIYQDFYPQDRVIITDAHKYLLDHYKEFNFIWASPPCPTHSTIRQRVGVLAWGYEEKYPDMALYEEIIFLTHHFTGKFCIENVVSYYEPLIRPQEVGRHYFWANFPITKNSFLPESHIKGSEIPDLQDLHGINLRPYPIRDKRKILRNCVLPELGLHIFKCAFKEVQTKLS